MLHGPCERALGMRAKSVAARVLADPAADRMKQTSFRLATTNGGPHRDGKKAFFINALRLASSYSSSE